MINVFVAILSLWWATVASAADTPIPVSLTAKPVLTSFKSGQPLPIALTISNGLNAPLRFTTFFLSPNEWNGETLNISLVDVYRDGEKRNLYLRRPAILIPIEISGPASRPIPSNHDLTVMIDASKWEIDRGWLPGHYKVVFRAEDIIVDSTTTLSVLSDPAVEITVE